MNRSHIEHTVVAIWLQCIPGMVWGDWVIVLRGRLMFSIKYLWWLCRYGYYMNPYEIEARKDEKGGL